MIIIILFQTFPHVSRAEDYLTGKAEATATGDTGQSVDYFGDQFDADFEGVNERFSSGGGGTIINGVVGILTYVFRLPFAALALVAEQITTLIVAMRRWRELTSFSCNNYL